MNNLYEKQVLGAILQSDESTPDLMAMVHEDMFSSTEYKDIFRSAKYLYDSGRQVSIISILTHNKKARHNEANRCKRFSSFKCSHNGLR
jgi:replicative DNA helicase